MDDHHKKNRKQIRESLFTFKDLAELILDEAVDDDLLRMGPAGVFEQKPTVSTFGP